MPHRQQGVDLALGIADAGLEDPHQVVEDDQPLAVLGRDRHQPAVAHERGEDGVLGGVVRQRLAAAARPPRRPGPRRRTARCAAPAACPSRCTSPARASRRAARATSLSGRSAASATSSMVPAPSARAATTLQPRRVGQQAHDRRGVDRPGVHASDGIGVVRGPPQRAGGLARLGSVSMTSGRGFSEDMRLAHVLADQADSISLDRFKAQDLKVDTKPDLTPVTDADRAVEEMLRITLSRARTRDAVMGEEFGTTGHGPRRWVLDPIDGTKNFVRGVPVWATLIALFDGDEPVVGLVSAPALNKRWWAAKDVGAWTGRRLESATRCRVSEVTDLADASLSYSSLSGWEERGALDGFLDLTRVGLAHPRLRRLLELLPARRGRGRHRLRARGLGLGPRRARRDRPRGRRPVHRPLRRARSRRRQRAGHQRRPARRRPPRPAPCTTPPR